MNRGKVFESCAQFDKQVDKEKFLPLYLDTGYWLRLLKEMLFGGKNYYNLNFRHRKNLRRWGLTFRSIRGWCRRSDLEFSYDSSSCFPLRKSFPFNSRVLKYHQNLCKHIADSLMTFVLGPSSTSSSKSICMIYLHPLSKFLGPKLAAATKVPIAAASWNGALSHWLKDLNQYYSTNVVRIVCISSDELSFISPSAWKDSCGNRQGRPSFPKDLGVYAGVKSIHTAKNMTTVACAAFSAMISRIKH